MLHIVIVAGGSIDLPASRSAAGRRKIIGPLFIISIINKPTELAKCLEEQVIVNALDNTACHDGHWKVPSTSSRSLTLSQSEGRELAADRPPSPLLCKLSDITKLI